MGSNQRSDDGSDSIKTLSQSQSKSSVFGCSKDGDVTVGCDFEGGETGGTDEDEGYKPGGEEKQKIGSGGTGQSSEASD